VATSIEQAKELKALLEEQNKLMSKQTSLLNTQLGIMQQMSEAVRQMNVEGLGRGIENLSGAVKNAADAVEELGSSGKVMQDLRDAAEENVDNLDKMGQKAESFGKTMLKLAPVVGTIEGMAGGFKLTMNAMSGLINIGGGLISTLFNLGASIIALPFKMLTGLMGQVGSGGSGLRQEFEKVRATFGDLASNEGKSVIDSWRGISHFGGQLAETGLSVWRTMGNMAESMAALREIAEQMGPLFHNFQRQLAEGGERIFAYQKGLHLTEEGMRAMTQTAARSGDTIQEVGRHMTSTAFAMGEAFGMNGALISQDIGNMMDDFEHFGSLGVQELSQVSVYARKLGVEIEKLTGALDQFADFDKAAESVAQLSQAFGIQLDTMQLVQEQDPAANIDRLRKAFFAAGRSIETMTRQERALLATQTGLDEKTASLVFSQQNQALSYQDIQKQGENAEKQQVSQAEAMQKLAGSIERLVKSGSALKGGFIDIFLQGFLRGIRRTKEFYGLMRNLRRAMRATYRAGREVGQMFVKFFPGVSDILTSIGDLFDPARFTKMLGGVKGAFRDFFKEMTTNPNLALSNLLDRLKESFTDWFDSSTPSGRRMLNGFKTFGKALAVIFAGLARQVISGLTEVFRGITSFISGDPMGTMAGAAQDASSGVMGFLMEVFEPIVSFFESSEGRRLMNQLWESFTEMLEAGWGFVRPRLTSFLEDNWPTILGVLFGPAVIGGLVRGLGTALAGGLLKSMVFGIGSAVKGAPGAISGALKGMDRVARGGSVSRGGRQASAVGEAASSAGDAVKAARRTRISPGDVAKMALLATVITVGLIAVALAMTALAGHIQKAGISIEAIKGAALIMIATGAVMLEIAGVIAVLALAGEAIKSFALQVIIGVAAIGLVGAAMALGAREMIDMFQSYSESSINKTVRIMQATSVFFLAAAAVAAAAGVIGTVIVATYGAGAAVILTGLAALSNVILAMVDTTVQVLQAIGRIRLDSATERKMDLFTSVLTAIGSFAADVGTIAAATSPGLADLLGQGESMTDRLNSVGRLVQTMTASMTDVISTLISEADRLEGISGDTGAMERTRFLADMLSTIGTVARDLRPPDSFNDTSLWGELTGDTVNARTTQLAMFIVTVINSIKGALTQIVEQINQLAGSGGFSEEAITAASALGEIIGAVGTLARMMTTFVTQEFRDNPSELGSVSRTIGRVITTLLDAIIGTDGSNIFTRMVNVVRLVVDAITGLDSSQLGALKAATPLISSMFTAIAGMSALVGNLANSTGVASNPEQIGSIMASLVSVVEAVTSGFGEGITGMLDNLVSTFSAISPRAGRNIKVGVESISTIFEAIGQIIEQTTSFLSGSANGDITEMGNRMSDSLCAVFKVIYNPGGRFTLTDFVRGIGRPMELFSELGPSLETGAGGFLGALRSLGSILEGVANFTNGEYFAGVETIDTNLMMMTKDAVVGMVQHIGDIDSALQRLRVININTRLRELNNKLGLRSTGRLDIREEPIQFHVNFTVNIDAQELENVLISRPNSRFAGLE